MARRSLIRRIQRWTSHHWHTRHSREPVSLSSPTYHPTPPTQASFHTTTHHYQDRPQSSIHSPFPSLHVYPSSPSPPTRIRLAIHLLHKLIIIYVHLAWHLLATLIFLSVLFHIVYIHTISRNFKGGKKRESIFKARLTMHEWKFKVIWSELSFKNSIGK